MVCTGKDHPEYINLKKFLDEILEQKPLDDRLKQAVFYVVTEFLPGKGEQVSIDEVFTLPFLCCKFVGGNAVYGEVISSVWSLLYLSLYLLDKVEDQEFTHPIFSSFDTGNLVNLTTCLIFCAEQILDNFESTSNINYGAIQRIRSHINRTILTMTSGQYLDLNLSKGSLADCLAIASKKSGAFFECACVIGALCAEQSSPFAENLKEFGFHLGLLTQVADDIEDFEKNGQIWGSTNIGVAFAQDVLSDKKSQTLSHLLKIQKQDQNARKQIRDILIENGSLVYLILEAEKQKFLAKKAIDEIEMPDFFRQAFLHHLEKFKFVKPIGKQ